MAYDSDSVSWCREHKWGAENYNKYQCDSTMSYWCRKNNYGAGFAEDIRLKCSEYGRPSQGGSQRVFSQVPPVESVEIKSLLPFVEVFTCAFSSNDPQARTACNASLQQAQQNVWADLQIQCEIRVDSYALGASPTTALTLICQGKATLVQIDFYALPPAARMCLPEEELVCGP